MTRQEKIREGIWHLLHWRADFNDDDATNEILEYLHSQGVVIKIDDRTIREELGFLPVGRVFVEPLMGTKKEGG